MLLADPSDVFKVLLMEYPVDVSMDDPITCGICIATLEVLPDNLPAKLLRPGAMPINDYKLIC